MPLRASQSRPLISDRVPLGLPPPGLLAPRVPDDGTRHTVLTGAPFGVIEIGVSVPRLV